MFAMMFGEKEERRARAVRNGGNKKHGQRLGPLLRFVNICPSNGWIPSQILASPFACLGGRWPSLPHPLALALLVSIHHKPASFDSEDSQHDYHGED
jgi:hypothetical protein